MSQDSQPKSLLHDYPPHTGNTIVHKFALVRYSDDFLHNAYNRRLDKSKGYKLYSPEELEVYANFQERFLPTLETIIRNRTNLSQQKKDDYTQWVGTNVIQIDKWTQINLQGSRQLNQVFDRVNLCGEFMNEAFLTRGYADLVLDIKPVMLLIGYTEVKNGGNIINEIPFLAITVTYDTSEDDDHFFIIDGVCSKKSYTDMCPCYAFLYYKAWHQMLKGNIERTLGGEVNLMMCLSALPKAIPSYIKSGFRPLSEHPDPYVAKYLATHFKLYAPDAIMSIDDSQQERLDREEQERLEQERLEQKKLEMEEIFELFGDPLFATESPIPLINHDPEIYSFHSLDHQIYNEGLQRHTQESQSQESQSQGQEYLSETIRLNEVLDNSKVLKIKELQTKIENYDDKRIFNIFNGMIKDKLIFTREEYKELKKELKKIKAMSELSEKIEAMRNVIKNNIKENGDFRKKFYRDTKAIGGTAKKRTNNKTKTKTRKRTKKQTNKKSKQIKKTKPKTKKDT